jgi:hypothetical protein
MGIEDADEAMKLLEVGQVVNASCFDPHDLEHAG